MISNVSFGSTFKVNNKENNYKKFRQFEKYALNIENKPEVEIQLADKFELKNPHCGTYDYLSNYIVVVPDKMDDDVETYCKNNGIKFHKYSKNDTYNPDKILARIKKAPKGYIKAMVDVDKLSELLKSQNSNFKHCQNDYEGYYKNQTDIMLKSAEPISAPTIFFTPNSSKEYMIKYINTFGPQNLNDGSLIIDLAQRTSEPEHCLYFALKDMGLKQIPVYVNKDSYDIGQALGIIK